MDITCGGFATTPPPLPVVVAPPSLLSSGRVGPLFGGPSLGASLYCSRHLLYCADLLCAIFSTTLSIVQSTMCYACCAHCAHMLSTACHTVFYTSRQEWTRGPRSSLAATLASILQAATSSMFNRPPVAAFCSAQGERSILPCTMLLAVLAVGSGGGQTAILFCSRAGCPTLTVTSEALPSTASRAPL